MSFIKYSNWVKQYDPEFLEMKHLAAMNVSFDDKNVLEVGCGTGRFTERILPLVKTIVGVDPDKDVIELCRYKFNTHKCNFLSGTLETLPINEKFFDVVIFTWSFHFIDDKLLNLQLATKFLKEDGVLIILQPFSGEYEDEIARLYAHSKPLTVYKRTCDEAKNLLPTLFQNVNEEVFHTYLLFEDINEVIDSAIYFVEKLEHQTPSILKIAEFKKSLGKYRIDTGKIKMSDNSSIFVAMNYQL